MGFRHALNVAAAIGLVVLGSQASPAFAAPQGPVDAQLGGSAVPGVCMLSREAVFANAKVGKAATARLQQLAQQEQSAIDAERKPLDTDIQTFRAQAASMKDADRQSREQALNQRMQTLQAHADLRSREIDATRAKALQRISQEAQPVIASVYKSRSCGMLLNRDAVLGGNMANDLTAAVVQGLDARITTISFDLEQLPAGSTGQTP